MTIQAWERTPFVGREPERDHLRRLLEGTVAGHGGLAVIAGEPGIGKTSYLFNNVTEVLERLACSCLLAAGCPVSLAISRAGRS